MRSPRRDGRPLIRDRRVLVPVFVVASYLLLAGLVFWPVAPFDASHLPNGSLGDPDELTWFLGWTASVLAHGHDIFLTHAIDPTTGVNLADNTSMPLLGVLGSPITALLGPIATFNVLLRLALASSAAACFFVLRRFCQSNLPPAIGGLIYGFSPAIVSQLQSNGHLDLVFIPLPPLLLFCLDEIAVRQQRSPLRYGALLGALFGAQYLISVELFADCALLGLAGVLLLALLHRSGIRSRLPYLARALPAAAVVFAVLVGYPISLQLAGPGHLSGPVQESAHLQRFRTDLLEPIVPDAREWIDPSGLAALSTRVLDPVRRAGGRAELGGYLGLPLVVLAAVLAARARRRGIVVIASLLGLIAFVASLGNRLQVDGHTTSIVLPEAVLGKLPLLDSTVPARYALFVVLFLVVVVAVGMDELATSWRSRRPNTPLGPALLAITLGATLLALVPRLPVSAETTALTGAEKSAVHALVPAGSVVLTYPYPEPPFAEAMLWQASDDFAFNLLGGYATNRAPDGKGELFPPLTEPDYVQELLSAAEAGAHSHYPAPPTPPDPKALLCSFLSSERVDVVLYSPYGANTTDVLGLFRDALGAPTAKADGLLAWRVDAHSCNPGT